MAAEKKTTLLLKGENGMMRKKYTQLSKTIADQKDEIKVLKDKERELREQIRGLDKDILVQSFVVRDAGTALAGHASHEKSSTDLVTRSQLLVHTSRSLGQPHTHTVFAQRHAHSHISNSGCVSVSVPLIPHLLRRFRAVMSLYSYAPQGHKKDIRDREETVVDKEKRIYDLRKKNQELEKFKFVLNYKIQELKRQIMPRKKEIQVPQWFRGILVLRCFVDALCVCPCAQ